MPLMDEESFLNKLKSKALSWAGVIALVMAREKAKADLLDLKYF